MPTAFSGSFPCTMPQRAPARKRMVFTKLTRPKRPAGMPEERRPDKNSTSELVTSLGPFKISRSLSHSKRNNVASKDAPGSPARRHSIGSPTAPPSPPPSPPADIVHLSAPLPLHHPKPISPGRRHSSLPPINRKPAEVVLAQAQSAAAAQSPPYCPVEREPQPQPQSCTVRAIVSSPSPSPSPPQKRQQQQPTLRAVVSSPSPSPSPSPPPLQKRPPSQPQRKIIRRVSQKIVAAPKPTLKRRDSKISVNSASPSSPSTPSASPPLPPFPPPPRGRLRGVSRRPPQTHQTQGTAALFGVPTFRRPAISAYNYDSTDGSSNVNVIPIMSTTMSMTTASRRGSVSTQCSSSTTTSKNAERPTTSHGRPSTGASHGKSRQPTRASTSASASSSRRRHSRPYTDIIDTLDETSLGGAYHHSGPYDATLATANTNKKLSPVAAVHDSLMEALQATPQVYIRDSLTRHVPLQGVATIPSGLSDNHGHTLNYKEGARLMYVPDAPGGDYKVSDNQTYHPELDDAATAARHPHRQHRQHSASFSYGDRGYELQDRSPSARSTRSAHYRRSSVDSSMSDAVPLLPTSGPRSSVPVREPYKPYVTLTPLEPTREAREEEDARFDVGGPQRQNSASRRISNGIKRRFGSLRRK